MAGTQSVGNKTKQCLDYLIFGLLILIILSSHNITTIANAYSNFCMQLGLKVMNKAAGGTFRDLHILNTTIKVV